MPETVYFRSAAERECTRICWRVIRNLQGIWDAIHCGHESGLRDAWDEFCVQVQSEQSVFWDAYEDTVRQVIAEEIRKVFPTARQTICLQTDAGLDWTVEISDADESRPADRSTPPVTDHDVVNYLYGQYVLARPQTGRTPGSGPIWIADTRPTTRWADHA